MSLNSQKTLQIYAIYCVDIYYNMIYIIIIVNQLFKFRLVGFNGLCVDIDYMLISINNEY